MKREMPVHTTPRRFGRLSAVYRLAMVTAAISFVAALPGEASEQQRLATKVGYTESEHGALVTVVAVRLPELRCDLWCYEDRLGKPVGHEKDGDTLVLTHRANEAKVTSRFIPVADGVEIRVEVSGPEADAVKAVGSLNPCCQFRHSDAFRNRGDYVDDFVVRCFVILQRGLTHLDDTRRIPGTRERENDKANLPKPWIQEYFPVWRKHPGQVPGQRGYSLDRPVYPLIGCTSRDGKYLAAIVWPEARSLGQVWHDCLHPRPAIGESYDAEKNRIVSRGRVYFLPNDEATLLAAFRRDFPDWRRPQPRNASAGPPRVLPAGKLPADTRLGPLRGERGDFSLVPATSPEDWKQRADRVRQIMRVSLGLWPMPTASPMNPVVHGRRDCGDYTVEKVYFESIPGFYVTGNLYRPKGNVGGRPGVLSPHGHFPGGRFFDCGPDAVRRQIEQGAERFEDGGRSFMQSRCVQLARMRCVVFHYDMIGYGDSVQIPLDVAHRFSQLRKRHRQPPAQGLYSAEAELHLHNPMGLHTYNSIRALDFLTSLEDVDPQRIAVTGGSGGGTQTFMLCAVDDRPLVSVPVVIVSTTRQGGCTCENISGLRIGTYNLEFTALHAPKPLLLISADDATRTMPERGFPQLKQHYQALGAEENVSHEAFLQFPHNYNCVSRAATYDWVNRHLGLGLPEPIVERSYRRLTQAELSVWNEEHPRPKGGPGSDRKVLQWLTDDARRQLTALTPRDPESLVRYREIVGTAWEVLLRRLPEDPEFQFRATRSADRGTHHRTLGLLSYRSVENHEAELPIVLLSPKEGPTRTVIWISRKGKSGLYAGDGSLEGPIRTLLEGGVSVIGVDLLYQGEFLADGRPIKRQRSLPDEDGFAGWTYCYNLSLLARRVQDILAVVAFAKEKEVGALLPERLGGCFAQKGPDPSFPEEVDLVGLQGAGHWVAAAAALSHRGVARAAIDTSGFRFAQLADVYDVDFLPGAAKYGDLPGLMALAAPARLWLAGEGSQAPPVASAAFAAAGAPENLTLFSGEPRDTEAAALEWLLSRGRSEQ